MSNVLIYGATGYMGKLCARQLQDQDIHPILAGRSNSVQAIAQTINCPARVFRLDHPSEIERHLSDIHLVINLAGPFQQTQKSLIKGCLAAQCHYLDIAGEVNEMLSVYAFDQEAKQSGIMLMPGAGFGIVPTDIAASMAKALLPDASSLTIAYATEGGVSRGTLKTVLQTIDQPGVRRVNDEFEIASPAESNHEFMVAGKMFTGVYNPWRADLFTAGLSTGIQNIQTYSVFPDFIVQMMQGKFLWLRNLLLQFLPEGPSEKQLQRGSTYVMAQVKNATEQKSVSLKGPEAYLFSALCLTAITTRVLNGNTRSGFQTPAYFGKTLLDSIDTIEWS
ncbi:saccharopine dehydrogenase NADP-binding domain-containing protein [Acaryochloris sp. IP29b_bin.137]|uniref:saccharopine dehydrogenase family protein n=1 Tax=Acaryochloris sp. IP29b_bin.137 TaxID=2969217 RepID=UPI00260E1328|nr:saccharopine dehydrogenase NADP-binding domain-containing protein [Acaryochloris sp. IP29b_bin.137]